MVKAGGWMNRRGFLGTLGVLSAGLVLDPELALWVPGRKSYFDIRPTLQPGTFVTLEPGSTYIYLQGIGEGLAAIQHPRNVRAMRATDRGPVGVWDGEHVIVAGRSSVIYDWNHV